MASTAASLKARHRQLRTDLPGGLAVRIHRAISWLARAEREADDDDARFLFLWISLNAAYASEFGFERSEREQSRAFVAKLLAGDAGQRLHEVVFRQFSGPIRTLVENRYVYEPFWRAQREHDGSGRWEEGFERTRRLALQAVMENRTDQVLSIVLDRLYVLRNQLVHGGATWHGAVNRQQVRDGAAILGAVVPVVIEVMMDAPLADYGAIAYPVLEG